MSTTARFLGAGVVVGLVAGLLVAALVMPPSHAAASGPSAAPTAPSGGTIAVAPNALPAITTTGGTNGTTTVSSAPATAIYPYFAGSPGIAPDHTIVVTGVGQADLQSDGSNRSAAQKEAITAAIADAKAQADAAASATGLSISGVLSVSISVSPNYLVAPMAGSGAIACPAVPPSSAGGATVPQPVCPPVYPQTQTLSASATVQYRVG
jgi:hypothetical protein